MTPQAFIAVIDAWSLGPSKIPQPCTHAYSVPDRSTPCSTTGVPEALTSWLPDTCSCGAVEVVDTTLTETGADVALLPTLSTASAVSE